MIDLPAATLERLMEARDASIGVETDTRKELNGKLFFALKGERFDGNKFIDQALQKGAIHAVSSDKRWKEHPRVIVVEDELRALQSLARAYRQRWSCPVLGMTGSNGKTTTKELIRDVLLTKYHVHATLGNLNNHIGVPLTLLNAPPNPEMVVVEMGANHQGEIALLSSIAEPTHGYITNIGLAHLDGFGGEHGVYLGKKELFDYLAKSGGTAFVQSSDAKVEQAASIVLDQVDVGPKDWNWFIPDDPLGLPSIQTPSGTTFSVQMEGSYNLANAVAAILIGSYFGIPEARAVESVSAYQPQNQRSQVIVTEKNWVLLDAYNANPSSMKLALQEFGRRNHRDPLVILGDMAELGKSSDEAHGQMAEQALAAGFELWTVGTTFGERHRQRMTPSWKHFIHVDQAITALKQAPQSQRQILIKGSRSMRLEELMPYL